jgi:hypothetical protein
MERRKLTHRERNALARFDLNRRLREQLRATRRDLAMCITEPCKRGYRYTDGSDEHVAEAKRIAELRWPGKSEEMFKDIDEPEDSEEV